MPRYFFHVDGGSEQPDTEDSELAGMGQIRSEAVRLQLHALACEMPSGKFGGCRATWPKPSLSLSKGGSA